MTAQRTDVQAAPTSADVAPVVPGEVVRRATLLCLRSEPHTEQSPCASHLTEATRQLFGIAS